MKRALLTLGLLLLPAAASAQSVDIIWSGVNYVPPFYQGGSLWSQEGSLMFMAVPQKLGNPDGLIYKWIKDGTVLGSVSGVGKNALYSNDPLFSKPQRIEVQIVNSNDTVLAQNSVTVTPVAPEILIYEQHPLYGFLFNREVGSSYRLDGAEATFGAFPLFFSARGRDDGATSYNWRSGGKQDSSESVVTYRVPEGTSGSSAISIKAANPKTVRQMLEKSFLIQFGNEK